jgi:hypothetical protein
MGKSIDWEKEVEEDYRQRIVVDRDSPILAFKANRDRYTNLPNQRAYAGLPYLGSRHSEDALTWNIFRSLQRGGHLHLISDSLNIGKLQGMLLWTLAPEIDDLNPELQYVTGSLIRKFDGRLPGQISEPDVILMGTKGIAVIECKLSEPDKAPSHLWERDLDSVRKRLPVYLAKNPQLLKNSVGEADICQVNQLVRMAFYAVEIGSHFGRQPLVISLANRRNWPCVIGKLGKSAAELWQTFLKILGSNSPLCKAIFWQDFPELLGGGQLEMLSSYISTHPCLASGTK